MRHFLLTLSLVVATITATMAQTTSYENYFTARAGVNFGDLVDPDYTSDSQTGFNAAILYNISLLSTAPLYLQSGLGIEMKGARSSNVLARDRRTHLKSYWLEVPVVLTYDVPINSKWAVVPEFGLFYAFAFLGSLDGDDEFYRPYNKQNIEIAGEGVVDSRLFRRSDFGLRMGVSFRYSDLLLGFAYDAGLINAFAEDIRDAGSEISTGCWSVNLQMRFN